MKKMKYLLPLLTATATVGAIAPLAVSCNKGEPEPEPTKTYTVKLADSDEGIELDKKEVTEKEKVDITLSWKNKDQKIKTLTVKTGETTLKLTDDYTTDASIAGKLKISIKEGKVVGDVVITAKFGEVPVTGHTITIKGEHIEPIEPIVIEKGMGLTDQMIVASSGFQIKEAHAMIGTHEIDCELKPAELLNAVIEPSERATLSIKAEDITGDVTVTITTRKRPATWIGQIAFNEYTDDNWGENEIGDAYEQGTDVWDDISVGSEYIVSAIPEDTFSQNGLVPYVNLKSDYSVQDDVVQIVTEGEEYINLEYGEDYEFNYTDDLNSITFKVLSIEDFKKDGEFLKNFTLLFKIDIVNFSFSLNYYKEGTGADLPTTGITAQFGIGSFKGSEFVPAGKPSGEIVSGEKRVQIDALAGAKLAGTWLDLLNKQEEPYMYVTVEYADDDQLSPARDEFEGYTYLYIDGEYWSEYLEEIIFVSQTGSGKSKFTYYIPAFTYLPRNYYVPLTYSGK